jgi:hypothetical protein
MRTATGTRVRKSTGRKILRRRLCLLRQTSLLLYWTTARLSPRNKVAEALLYLNVVQAAMDWMREPCFPLLEKDVGEIKLPVA